MVAVVIDHVFLAIFVVVCLAFFAFLSLLCVKTYSPFKCKCGSILTFKKEEESKGVREGVSCVKTISICWSCGNEELLSSKDYKHHELFSVK
jgi:hypothetical protein